LKILILAKDYPPTVGGVENYSYHLAEGLSQLNEIHVVTFAPNRKGVEKTDRINVKRIKPILDNENVKALQLLLYLFFFLMFKKVDLIHATTWKVGLAYAVLKSVFRKKFTLTVHGAEVTRHQHHAKIMKMMNYVLNKADKIISVSQFTKDKTLEYSALKAEKIAVVPNGIDISKLEAYPTNVAREKLNIPQDKFVILTVARVDDRKGHEVIIDAMQKIIDKHQNVRYVIVGKGPRLEMLKSKVDTLGLERYVEFTGFVTDDELNLYYSSCNVFAMLNTMDTDLDFEGFGYVFAEAGYFEKPVIGGDSGGPREVIDHQVTGYLISPEHDKFSSLILKIIEDETSLVNMGSKGRKHLEDNFTIRHVIEKTQSIIETV